jgi:cytochrome d ubiquinol oxidase subunit II
MTAIVWFVVISIGLILYVGFDGYDLGTGILAITQRDHARRRSMLELVALVWDGNESWLLLAAVGLWGGFPAAMGAILPALYPALIVMLFSLILRGVSIEMVSNARGWPRGWGWAFMAGSVGAAFAQGVVIGAILQGIQLSANARFTGGTFDFLTGYSVLTGLAAVVLYALAGAAMVKMRSNDAGLRDWAARLGRVLIPVTGGFVILSGALLSVAGSPALTIDAPLRIALMSWVCIAAVAMFALAWWSFGRQDHDNLPFAGVTVATAAGAVGVLVLLYPYLLPPDVTIGNAASPASSLDFLIGGFGMFVPLVLAYNLFAFFVLRPRRARPAQSGPAPAVPMSRQPLPAKERST